MNTPMGCWCSKWQLSLLYHNHNPYILSSTVYAFDTLSNAFLRNRALLYRIYFLERLPSMLERLLTFSMVTKSCAGVYSFCNSANC